MGPHTDTTQRIKASEELATSVCLGASELFGTFVYFCHFCIIHCGSLRRNAQPKEPGKSGMIDHN